MGANFTIKRGDLLKPIILIAEDAVGPVDLDGVTAVFRLVNMLTGAVKINNATASAAASIPFTASGATLTANGHGLINGQSVTGKSTGVLPGNLSTQTRYYVVNAGVNSLQLSLSKGGVPITTSSAGSGTHSLLSGELSYEWAGTDTDTAGTYHAEFITTQSGKPFTFPNLEPYTVEILAPADFNERGAAIKAVRDRVRPGAIPTLTTGEVELEVDRSKLATVWEVNTAYNIGDRVVPATRNGHSYICVQPGTSQGGARSFYDWPTRTGSLLADGSSTPQLIWREYWSDSFNNDVIGMEKNLYDIGGAIHRCWMVKAAMASEMVDAGNTSFEQVYKHCMEQAALYAPFSLPVEWARV